MDTGSMRIMTARIRQAVNQISCPECGDKMREVDRCNESGEEFIWYECCRGNCDGQWLRRKKLSFNPLNIGA